MHDTLLCSVNNYSYKYFCRSEIILIFIFRHWYSFKRQNGGRKAWSLPPTNPSHTKIRYLLLLDLDLNIFLCTKYFFFPVLGQTDTSGPVFIQEPPNYVDFSNTTGKTQLQMLKTDKDSLISILLKVIDSSMFICFKW